MRANGAVWAPLIILAIGLVPVRFGFDLRDLSAGSAPTRCGLSFPVSSFVNLALAVAYYLHGGWKKARHDASTQRPDEDECTEEALATREPAARSTRAREAGAAIEQWIPASRE